MSCSASSRSAFDSVGELYVASSNSDVIEQFAPGASGNVAPNRVLQGLATAIAAPSGIVLDSSGRLYVTNEVANSVTVYPPLASGNMPPLRTITGMDTGLSAPSGVVIDAAGHLWVSNLGANTLTEYASDANGNASPLGTIAGPATQLDHPEGLAQDSAGNLLVANFFGGSVLRFANASPYGNVAPNFAISGAQARLSLPQSVDLDTSQRVYVADENAGVNIYAAGATTPTATISGPATDIRAPHAVAVAPPMSIPGTSLPEAALGRRYAGRVFAILAQPPVRWRLIAGHLPGGLKFERSGQITGIARHVGRYRLTVAARDAEHPAQTAEGRVTLTVARTPTVSRVRATSGPRRGGQTVTISGTGFSIAPQTTTVSFGRIRAPLVRCPSRARCIVRTPPHPAGTIHVTVTVGNLTSQPSPRDSYTYKR